MLTRDEFARRLGQLLQDHLAGQEDARGAVSKLAAGAAFEAWLSFETRLIMEVNRDLLELAGDHDHHGQLVDRYWIGNEHQKVDLGITNVESDEWELALEFKLVHNNKNWKKKCDEVWGDLFPDDDTRKASIKPRLGRIAIVGVVGKVYWVGAGGYPGQRPNLDSWEREELWPYLLPDEGTYANQVDSLWQSRRFPIRGERWLLDRKEAQHFFQLHALAPTTL